MDAVQLIVQEGSGRSPSMCSSTDSRASCFDGRVYEGYRVSVRLVRENAADYEPRALRTAQDTYSFLRSLEDLDRETFWRVDLDARHRVIGCEEVSRGHLSGTSVHPREVYKGALLNSSSAIIIAHNHPSGDPTPSEEDQRLTDRLCEAGELLGVSLLDHVIIGHDSYWSMAERGNGR